MFHAASAQKYVDASTLTIIGRTCPMEGHPYYRVDTTRYRFDNATIRHYCGYPAGVAVLFTTDSRRIEARWTTAPRNYGWNMTPVLQRGMDLYVRENGVWTMAGAARPGLQDRHASTIVEHMDGQPKECMLYLPAWSELLTLEIGVDEGASVTPLESPYKHRVIVFGSSVTHGASASRPGMTYPARMSRMTGIEFVNLGYSGNCMLQPEFARLLAETDADAFLGAFQDVLVENVAKGEAVKITGLMGIERVERAARTGRNPRTGEEIQIPAGYGVKVTVGSSLKKAVAE